MPGYPHSSTQPNTRARVAVKLPKLPKTNSIVSQLQRVKISDKPLEMGKDKSTSEEPSLPRETLSRTSSEAEPRSRNRSRLDPPQTRFENSRTFLRPPRSPSLPQPRGFATTQTPSNDGRVKSIESYNLRNLKTQTVLASTSDPKVLHKVASTPAMRHNKVTITVSGLNSGSSQGNATDQPITHCMVNGMSDDEKGRTNTETLLQVKSTGSDIRSKSVNALYTSHNSNNDVRHNKENVLSVFMVDTSMPPRARSTTVIPEEIHSEKSPDVWTRLSKPRTRLVASKSVPFKKEREDEYMKLRKDITKQNLVRSSQIVPRTPR